MSHVHKIQDDPLPHPGPGSHVYSLKCDPTSQKLHVWSHVNGLQGNLLLTLYLGSNFCSIRGDSLPDHIHGVTCPVSSISPHPDCVPEA